MRKLELDGEFLIDEELIAGYLEANSDFFLRHPQLLQTLRIPHQQKGTVSLVEVQQKRLRDKVESLELEITDLMALASLNERIYRTYVNLLPDLIRCKSFAELEHRLRDALIVELNVADVSLRLNRELFDLPESLIGYGIDADQLERLRVTRLGQEPHYFGRISRGEQGLLFCDTCRVGSVAMVPLGQSSNLGVFSVASNDADHYVAGMDSLLLSQLCGVIATLLPELVDLSAS